jgi:hypothetical protein
LIKFRKLLDDPGLTPQAMNANFSFKILKLDKIQGTSDDPGARGPDAASPKHCFNSFKILKLDKIQGTPDDPDLTPQALNTVLILIKS